VTPRKSVSRVKPTLVVYGPLSLAHSHAYLTNAMKDSKFHHLATTSDRLDQLESQPTTLALALALPPRTSTKKHGLTVPSHVRVMMLHADLHPPVHQHQHRRQCRNHPFRQTLCIVRGSVFQPTRRIFLPPRILEICTSDHGSSSARQGSGFGCASPF
jgi:hypothetical protein